MEMNKKDSGRSIGALTLVLSTAFVLMAAHASDKVTDIARKQGLAKASELVKTAGIVCSVSDVRRISHSNTGMMTGAAGGGSDRLDSTDSGTGAKVTFSVKDDLIGGDRMPTNASVLDKYEVACGEDLGYLIDVVAEKKFPVWYRCIEVADAAISQPGIQPEGGCLLPGNSAAAQLRTVNAYLVKANANCDAIHLHSIGRNTDSTLIEAACSNGDGHLVLVPNSVKSNQAVKAVDCMSLLTSGEIRCQLTDAAAQLTATDELLHEAHPECQVVARRYIGTSVANDKFFEFRCQDNNGYVLKKSVAGLMAGAAACTDPAVATLGGCMLGESAKNNK